MLPKLALPAVAGVAIGLLVLLLAGRAGSVAAVPLGAAGWWVVRRMIQQQRPELDRRSTALVLELISAGLLTGLPVSAAIEAVDRVVADYGDAALARALQPVRLVGRLLTLGGDPVQAWSELEMVAGLRGVAAAGRRCAHSGARLAGALTETASELRAEHRQLVLSRAQRTGVWALLPLGCCFLPAFVCLGVVPVVIGIVGQVFGGGSGGG